MFPEFSYDELKEVMNAWLNPDSASSSEGTVNTIVDDEVPAPAPKATAAPKSPSAATSKTNVDDVAAAFDNLFNS
mgnify:FL=1